MDASSEVCLLHHNRRATGALGSSSYCADCLAEIAGVVRALPVGVAPRECYAVALPGGRWSMPVGGGAAHWLAHEIGIRPAHARAHCAAGFAVRRADLLFARRELIRELPRPGDLWADLDEEGCGLVSKSAKRESDEVEISIRGLLGAQGAISVCDFYRDLHGRGRFFR